MNKKLKYRIISMIALGSIQLTSLVYAVPAVPPQSDPGVQMQRDKGKIRQQQIERDLEKQRTEQTEGVQDKRRAETGEESKDQMHFFLKKLDISKSAVISESELQVVTNKYQGQEVTIQDLYKIVAEINGIYQKKGYVVCQAILPEQTIKQGVVKILLIEGKTGQIFIEGNRTTKEGYIKERLGLNKGDIANLLKLNDDLFWFNGTNDVQLRIEMKAGSVPGTTDYYVVAYEPKQQSTTLFVDNSGSDSTGEWRTGLSYTNVSLTGRRDSLSIMGLRSRGNNSGAINYAYPINSRGTKLGLNYSSNGIEIVEGMMHDLNVKGHSSAWGASLQQPFIVTKKKRLEGSIELQHQASVTNFMDFPWVDDQVDDITLAMALTNYADNAVLYQRHSYTAGIYSDNILEEKRKHGRYNFAGIYQYLYPNRNQLMVRVNGQYSSTNYLPSAEQFYIGGAYSVRGYVESFLGADSGFSTSIEYSVPDSYGGNLLMFCDGGGVFGKNAFADHSALSLGLGYRAQVKNNVMATVSLGFPMKRGYVSHEVSKSRLHCFVNGTL